MAQRLTLCPKCQSSQVDTVVVHTTEMNAHATLKCLDCQHQWEGKVTSPHHEEQRRRGWAI